MAKAATKVVSLTANKIDGLAQLWVELETKAEAIDQAKAALRESILECVDAQGELADRSSKTKLVEGNLYELRATYGEETRIDQKIAREFLDACPRDLGAQIFRREEKLVLVETPDRLVGGAELPVAVRRLFQEAVKVKPRSPKVEVRSKLAKT
jgi:hypothetical protein